MNADYRGYPVVCCPECGASDQVEVLFPVDKTREFGPGEWTMYQCMFCIHAFRAIMPEPPDNYEGDGVFARNH